jgi:hypothetical protein
VPIDECPSSYIRDESIHAVVDLLGFLYYRRSTTKTVLARLPHHQPKEFLMFS